MSSPPPASIPVVLGLGLGGGVSGQVGKPPPPQQQLQHPSHPSIPTPPPSMGSLFTFMQLQELQQQALIYKYMSSGLPVPLHLVLPIWKSMASSAAASAYQQHYHPAMMMGFKFDVGLLGGFDYKNLLEPEPGRCRRTDGKKWRCARDVVPDHKYCDKHRNRGRNRSRKHVEQQEQEAASAAAVATGDVGSNNGNKTKDGTSGGRSSMDNDANTNGNRSFNNNSSSLSPVLSVPPTSLQLMPPTSHCPTTTNSSINRSGSVYGGDVNSLAALRSYAAANTNNAASNLFNSASPPQMFGLSPTSVLLGDRTTTGVSYF